MASADAIDCGYDDEAIADPLDTVTNPQTSSPEAARCENVLRISERSSGRVEIEIFEHLDPSELAE